MDVSRVIGACVTCGSAEPLAAAVTPCSDCQKRECTTQGSSSCWCGVDVLGASQPASRGLAFSRRSMKESRGGHCTLARGNPLRRSFGWCSCLPATTRNDGGRSLLSKTQARLFEASFGFQQGGHRQSRKETHASMHVQHMIIILYCTSTTV